jgi:hypothetical protein
MNKILKFAMVFKRVFNVGWFQVFNIQLLTKLTQQLPIIIKWLVCILIIIDNIN